MRTLPNRRCHGIPLFAGAMGIGLALSVLGAPTASPPTPDMVTTEDALKSVITTHTIVVAGKPVHYLAWFEESLLVAGDPRAQASISATSYVSTDHNDPMKRPVLFVFNGGPGASSSPLHFSALGPKRVEQQGAERQLVDNESSLIDVADLVFIDPVATGFSRERPGAAGRFFGPHEDARAVLTLIRQWQRDQHRERSPLFIAGESYGGFRIAMMMQDLQGLAVAGLILISPALDMSATSGGATGNDLPFILELPSMAAAAWEHQKIDRAGRTLEAFFSEAATFSQSEFALGLLQGAALPASERRRLAVREAAFIGLPAESIERANLRLDSQSFLERLMGPGMLVGRVDTRVVAEAPKHRADPDRPAAADDPALGLGTSNVIKSPLVKHYFERDMKLATNRDYIAVSLDVNFRWNWQELIYDPDPKDPSFYVNPTLHIAEAMKAQPHLRVLLIQGYYDLAVPMLAPRYALSHAGVPSERVVTKALPGPHSPFDGASNRREGTDAIRDFLREVH